MGGNGGGRGGGRGGSGGGSGQNQRHGQRHNQRHNQNFNQNHNQNHNQNQSQQAQQGGKKKRGRNKKKRHNKQQQHGQPSQNHGRSASAPPPQTNLSHFESVVAQHRQLFGVDARPIHAASGGVFARPASAVTPNDRTPLWDWANRPRRFSDSAPTSPRKQAVQELNTQKTRDKWINSAKHNGDPRLSNELLLGLWNAALRELLSENALNIKNTHHFEFNIKPKFFWRVGWARGIKQGTNGPDEQTVEELVEQRLAAQDSFFNPRQPPPSPMDIAKPPPMRYTPTLDLFLKEIEKVLSEKEGDEASQALGQYLPIEPPFGFSSATYYSMIEELKHDYPASKNVDDELEAKCAAMLPTASLGKGDATWGAFIKFISSYLCYLRDLNTNLWDTFQLIKNLIIKTNTALAHASMGEMMLSAAIVYCRALSKIALGLHKQPELIGQLDMTSDDEPNLSLPERAANIIRMIFVTCLNDRTSVVRDGIVTGKKAGVYIIANIVLKMLFQAKRIQNAEQVFTNIGNQALPLRHYLPSQRITYLYYLGRYMFATNHFYRAVLPLQAALDQTPHMFLKHRRKILIYLITSNIILGRFPKQQIWDLTEANGFQKHFQPFINSVIKGDLEAFRRVTDIRSEHGAFFFRHSILLQLKLRCEVHVWRSLLRRTFLLVGDQGAPPSEKPRRAPSVSIKHFLAVLRYLEFRALSPLSVLDRGPGRRHTSFVLMPTPDSDASAAPQGYTPYISRDFAGLPEVPQRPPPILPDLEEAEAIVSSLVMQGYANGFLAHRASRFAIQGARKAATPVKAGFPSVWEANMKVLDDEVPGWKRDEWELPNGGGAKRATPFSFGGGPGRVIHLSGARPAGSF